MHRVSERGCGLRQQDFDLRAVAVQPTLLSRRFHGRMTYQQEKKIALSTLFLEIPKKKERLSHHSSELTKNVRH
jgi:hypothetical protein